MISVDEFDSTMSERGWVIFPAVVAKPLLDAMLNSIHEAYLICRDIQVKNGIGDGMEHTVHHLPALQRQRCWLDYLETMAVAPYIERFFGGPYVLNSFGGALNQAHSMSYAHEVHRDVRSFTGTLPLMLNTLVMLDAFTRDNGATYLLSGSHKSPEKPDHAEFMAKAERATGPAGSVLMFNANLWHAGGENTTPRMRRSVTPIFSKPFFRPEFDYCRALGGGARFSPALKQVLGFNARVPATLHDFYQPPEKRFYRKDQG